MTRTYDSGLSKPLVTLVREGIIAKLAPTLRTQGGFAHAVIAYPMVMGGDLDYAIDLLIDLTGNRTPVYAVAVGDISSARAGAAGYYLGDLDVEVYCMSNHMRGIVDGRLHADVGAQIVDALDPGVEVMRELARMLLTDQVPVVGGTAQANNQYSVYGSKAKELRYSGQRELITSREQTVWGVRFSVQLEEQANMLRGASELLEEIRALHRIGAGETPDPTAPTLIDTITEVP